jgi:hypothetical protein
VRAAAKPCRLLLAGFGIGVVSAAFYGTHTLKSDERDLGVPIKS